MVVRSSFEVKPVGARGSEVFLPAAEVVDVSLPRETRNTEPRGGTETILLVEDESNVRVTTRVLLERQGYQVLEAADGVEALQIWEQRAGLVHLLLTDIVIP